MILLVPKIEHLWKQQKKAAKLKKLEESLTTPKQESKSKQTLVTDTLIPIEEQVKGFSPLVERVKESSITSDIQNITDTNLVTSTHSTGCYAHTQKLNTHFGICLVEHLNLLPDLILHFVDADNVDGWPMLISFWCLFFLIYFFDLFFFGSIDTLTSNTSDFASLKNIVFVNPKEVLLFSFP